MKKLLLICLSVLVGAAAFSQTKDARSIVAKEVEQRYAVTTEKAKELIAIKELYNRQISALQMPHVERELSRTTIAKKIEDLRKEELGKMTAALQDEKKATEVSKYLEGRVQFLSQPRPR